MFLLKNFFKLSTFAIIERIAKIVVQSGVRQFDLKPKNKNFLIIITNNENFTRIQLFS